MNPLPSPSAGGARAHLLPLLSAEQMRNIDRVTIEERGIPGHRLMDEAGGAVWAAIRDYFAPDDLVVLAGKGNNGGDGLVVSRLAHAAGVQVRLHLLADPTALRGEALHHFEQLPPELRPAACATVDDVRLSLAGRPEVVVDALLGIGASGPLRGDLAEVVAAINALRAGDLPPGARPAIVAVDIPSGLPADPGAEFEAAVHADLTVTFGAPKTSMVVMPGLRLTGRLLCKRLSFPADLFEGGDIRTHLATGAAIGAMLPPRRGDGHKGTFGGCLLIGGSEGLAGAPILMTQGALRSGVGRVSTAVPRGLVVPLIAAEPAAMAKPIGPTGHARWTPDCIGALLPLAANCQAVVVGPGFGLNDEAAAVVRELLAQLEVPLLLDADALTLLSRLPDAVELCRRYRGPLAMTPHPGEMARLFGVEKSSDIQRDRFGAVRAAAERFGAAVLLKGGQSLVATRDGHVTVNPTGNSGLARGGSGDVLAGLAAGLGAQGMGWPEALTAAAYLHGFAADLAIAAGQTSYTLTHRDVLAQFGAAFAGVLRPDGTAQGASSP